MYTWSKKLVKNNFWSKNFVSTIGLWLGWCFDNRVPVWGGGQA